MTVALDETFDLIVQHDINAREIDEIEIECMQRLALFDIAGMQEKEASVTIVKNHGMCSRQQAPR